MIQPISNSTEERISFDAWLQETQTPDLVDARFLERAALDTTYTIQYMELYQGKDNVLSGRLLDVAHYENATEAHTVYRELQASTTDGSLTPTEIPLLATTLAEMNGLPSNSWQIATPEDHARYFDALEADLLPATDIPSEPLAVDPLVINSIFAPTVQDGQVLEALRGIGLTPQADFNLERDSFYDPVHDEHLFNGIFQRDLADPSRDAHPLLVSVAPIQDGAHLSAQAVEYGHIGSLVEVQADVERVQAAIEQSGVAAGIAAIETLNTELTILAAPSWSLDIT